MNKFQHYFSDGGSTPDESYLRELASRADDPILDAEMYSVFESLDRRLESRPARRPHVWGWCAVCMAALLLPLAGFFFGRRSAPVAEPLPPEIVWQEIRVPDGQTMMVDLPDGSRFQLNSGSRLTYPDRFTGPVRNVFLDGEVYAEVFSDPTHPFTISSGDIDVKVLGTTFDFNCYSESDCVELFLLEGSVDMDLRTTGAVKEISMKPGNIVHFERSSASVTMDNFDPATYKPFFVNHSLNFYNLKLSDIVLELQRQFNAEIVITDQALAEKRFFSIFSNSESLYQILRTLNTESCMKISKRGNIIYLSSK